jgi:hypothetical protein
MMVDVHDCRRRVNLLNLGHLFFGLLPLKVFFSPSLPLTFSQLRRQRRDGLAVQIQETQQKPQKTQEETHASLNQAVGQGYIQSLWL